MTNSIVHYLVFLILDVISILTNLLVAVNSIGSYNKSYTSFLIFWLHVTLITESFSVFPTIFNHNQGLCTFINWLNLYSSLSNILIFGLLVLHYRSFFNSKNQIICLEKYSIWIILILPGISLLPFTTNSFNNDYDNFCTFHLSSYTEAFWALFVLYLWSWIIIFLTIFFFSYSFYHIYKIDKRMAQKLFSSLGLYVIISLFSWIPRTILSLKVLINDDDSENIVIQSFYPVLISGILYFLVYLKDRQSIKQFEKSIDREIDEINGFSINLNEFDLLSSLSISSTISGNSTSNPLSKS